MMMEVCVFIFLHRLAEDEASLLAFKVMHPS